MYRHSLLYVYEPRFEVGGQFWPRVLKWVVVLLHIAHLFMACMFFLLKFYVGVVACVFLTILARFFIAKCARKEAELLR